MNNRQKEILNRAILAKDKQFLKNKYNTAKVRLYHYTDEKWVEMNIEGPLYVYERSFHPKHYIFILNHKLKGEFYIGIDNTEYSIHENFVAIGDPTSKKVYGLWFFDSRDFDPFCKVLNEIKNVKLDASQEYTLNVKN